ncbi:MAG: alpha-galactosidase [Ilumatobacteraceae bacterium]
MASEVTRRIEHLSAPTCSVIVDVSTGVPAIWHWGAPLGAVEPDLVVPDSLPFGALDVSTSLPLVPMHGDGFAGRPGLQGHRRGGRHWSPRFHYVDHTVGPSASGGTSFISRARDEIAEILLTSELDLDPDGVLCTRVTVTNEGDSPYMVDALSVSLALPETATELGVHTGRWAREFDLHRFTWPVGSWTSENRTGRSSHEHPPYVWACSIGASEWSGEVWGVHLAWSGNSVFFADTTPSGRRYLQTGELFQAGEMCLDAGGSLTTPVVVGVHSGRGFTPASWGLHRLARRWSPRPAAGPRPVHINTWAAVYFDQDETKLRQLADVAASVGIERFVLDDGWFGTRRSDRSGLGDWDVSAEVYPLGLRPLVDHVTGLGMEFGIWVEPEMVNPDSDLFRQHPDWVLTTDGYEPVLGRHQLVLDLTNDLAREHILERLDALLSDHRISYVKWDMNRPHVQASNAQGKAASHAQALAVWALLDELRRRHPDVEFESCASGGGRVDHGMLRRVERVWTSDCNDALERQFIQRGASMVIPPEVMGCHIGPPVSHTTGRRHALAFRGVTALFGHLGVEWDITAADETAQQQLAHVIGLYKRYRHLVHHGDTVRFAVDDDPLNVLAHGVYSTDRSEALISFVQLRTGTTLHGPHLRLPDLDPNRRYSVTHVPLTPQPTRLGPAVRQPAWIDADTPISSSGSVLAAVGVPMPILWPESAVLVHLSAS